MPKAGKLGMGKGGAEMMDHRDKGEQPKGGKKHKKGMLGRHKKFFGFGGDDDDFIPRPNAYYDPYYVPSAFHMGQMVPWGMEWSRMFPRFHPSWMQRVSTPVPRVSAFPLHGRGNLGHSGAVGQVGGGARRR